MTARDGGSKEASIIIALTFIDIDGDPQFDSPTFFEFFHGKKIVLTFSKLLILKIQKFYL